MSMENGNEPKDSREHSSEEQAGQHEPESPEEFSFLQERIKKEPVNKKKLVRKIARVAGLGLVFGLAASLSFYALKPWAETKFQNKETEVTIPKDEEDEASKEEDQKEEPQTAPILTVDSYEEMNQALYAVVKEAEKSVVEVTGVRADDEWTNKSFDSVNSVAGAIVYNNGQQLLIVCKSSIAENADSLMVEFADGSTCQASVKRQDNNLGIAVVGVANSEIGDSTWNQIKVGTLGNSNVLNRGDTVMALGRPFGYNGGVGYGIVSSVKNETVLADGKFDLVSTDIPGTAKGTGILVNIDGEVVGIIDQDVLSESGKNFTTALAISDMKEELELLSNGASVPYIGIRGTDVTEEISEQQGIPRGVYVKEVEVDSPAMAAGIQSGDVILKFNKTTVSGLDGFYNIMMSQKTGDSVKILGQRRGANGYVNVEFTVTIGSKE